MELHREPPRAPQTPAGVSDRNSFMTHHSFNSTSIEIKIHIIKENSEVNDYAGPNVGNLNTPVVKYQILYYYANKHHPSC